MPDTTLGVEAAKRRLPELLEREAAGERIVIQSLMRVPEGPLARGDEALTQSELNSVLSAPRS